MLTALGPRFVEELMASFASLPGSVAYVALDGQAVVGFVVGSEDAAQHRSAFIRRRWFSIALHVLPHLATSPACLWRLAQYLRGRVAWMLAARRTAVTPAATGSIPAASLILLGVASAHRRHGIADQLTQAFLDELSERGVRSVKLAVAANNGPALSFYRSRGWKESGFHRTPEGVWVYRLIYELAASGCPSRR